MTLTQTPTLYNGLQHQHWNAYLDNLTKLHYPQQEQFTELVFTPHAIYLDRRKSTSILESRDPGFIKSDRDASGKITRLTSPYAFSTSKKMLKDALTCCPLQTEIKLNGNYDIPFQYLDASYEVLFQYIARTVVAFRKALCAKFLESGTCKNKYVIEDCEALLARPFSPQDILHVTLGAYVYYRSFEKEVWAFGWHVNMRTDNHTTSYSVVDFDLFDKVKKDLHKYL